MTPTPITGTTAEDAVASAAISPGYRARVLGGALSGSTIEWFEFFLYASAAALVFDKQFFPSDDPSFSLLLSYLTLSLTFFIRPLGGIVFAHLGDRIGRKRTLIITLWMMGLATMAIGLLPTSAAIGIWAPALLITCRLIQGLAISGEWGGAILLAYEYAPRRLRGLFGSVPQMGTALGMLLATLAMAGLTQLPGDDFQAWGWRLPFIASLLLVIIGLWLRSSLDETPEFRRIQEQGRQVKLPIAEVLRHQWRAVLVAVGAKFVETAPFYVVATFVLSYATARAGFGRGQVLLAVSIAAALALIMIPLFGSLSDRVGRRLVFVVGALGTGAFIFPYYTLVDSGQMTGLVLASTVALGLLWPAVTATYGTISAEMFTPEVRYTGISMGQQIGAALAGGTAPLIATLLLAEFDGSGLPVAVMVAACAAVSLIAIAYSRRAARVQ